MKPPAFYRILSLVILLALAVSCAPQPPPGPVPATVEGLPTVTPTDPSQVTRTPKEAGDPGEQVPQAFPPSSDTPVTSDFNLILGRPTANSIAASLYATSDQQIVIAYGTQSGEYTHQTAPIFLTAGIPQTIVLSNLAADTTYFYTTTGGAEHTFHTARTPGSSFTFTVDADTHNRDPNFNGELYAITLVNALADHPDFHINLGDTFMTEKARASTYAEAESTFADLRPYFGVIGAEVPLFLVNGNHEGELGWLLKGRQGQNLPLWSTQLRQLYYPNPVPNDFYSGSITTDAALNSPRDGYYAWTWGEALFVVLDPFWYTTDKPRPDDPDSNWIWTLGKEQYDWLKSTLEAGRSRFKFVFIHHLVGGGDKDARGGIEAVPYFEWGGENADGTYGFDEHRPGWGNPIHQLLVQNHVNAVFHGHDHVFVKQDLDGIIYQEVPQPSMARYDNIQLAQDYGYTHGDVLGSSGHLRITVTPDYFTIEYVRAYLPQDEKPGQQNGQTGYGYSCLFHLLPASQPK